MIRRLTGLAENLVQFCRFLRQNGFGVNIEEETTALQALSHINFSDQHEFYEALKASLCRNRHQVLVFAGLYNQYWKDLFNAVDSKSKQPGKSRNTSQQPSLQSLKSWLHGNRSEKTEMIASYSATEKLTRKDFSLVPGDDVDDLMNIIRALGRRLALRKGRRYKLASRANEPDLRFTLRKNLRRGGELIELGFRKPKRNRYKILLLCDVSKSMELYTAFLLQFIYSFRQVYNRMEVFVFGTGLQRITPLLKEQNFRKVLSSLDPHADNWGAGTRIGASLQEMLQQHNRFLVDSKTITVIMSDGWDTGDTELLRSGMEAIQKRCKKLIWLNPLAGYDKYDPRTTGMRTAMPYIDLFAPVHNAESLAAIGRWF